MGLAEEADCCVISEELARNLFGSVNVVGERLKTEDRMMTVAGVMDLVIMLVTVDMLKCNSVVMKVLSNVLVILLNYVSSKLVIFRE